MEVKGRRDLHKSLELLLKKSEKGLRPQMGAIGSPGKNKGMNQMANPLNLFGGPNGIRTRVTDVRGQCPRPLDDGTLRNESIVNNQ